MSLIKTRILQSQFELIRDRIGAILADEFSYQAVTFNDSDLSGLKVWISRSVPFDKTNPPAVNVNFVHGDYYSEDVSTNTNIYKFSIDCHAAAKTQANGKDGDELGMYRVQKLMGIACRILNNTQYRTLGWAAPSVQTRWIESMDVADPARNDADSMMFGRIIFSVRINEDIQLLTAKNIQGYDTKAQLDLTNEGYMYKVNAYA